LGIYKNRIKKETAKITINKIVSVTAHLWGWVGKPSRKKRISAQVASCAVISIHRLKGDAVIVLLLRCVRS
jgi:hypothetical protein